MTKSRTGKERKQYEKKEKKKEAKSAGSIKNLIERRVVISICFFYFFSCTKGWKRASEGGNMISTSRRRSLLPSISTRDTHNKAKTRSSIFFFFSNFSKLHPSMMSFIVAFGSSGLLHTHTQSHTRKQTSPFQVTMRLQIIIKKIILFPKQEKKTVCWGEEESRSKKELTFFVLFFC